MTEDTENTNTTDTRRIERRIKNVRRYSKRIRERNVCPNCNSMDVAKRTTTKDYKCYNCKWIGKDINRVMA
jgi:ribosomal protein L37AE/L43A